MSERTPMPAATGLSGRQAPPGGHADTPRPERLAAKPLPKKTPRPPRGKGGKVEVEPLVAAKTRRRALKARNAPPEKIIATTMTLPYYFVEQIKHESHRLDISQAEVLLGVFDVVSSRLPELVRQDLAGEVDNEHAILYSRSTRARREGRQNGRWVVRMQESTLANLDHLVMSTQAANRSHLCRVALAAYFI